MDYQQKIIDRSVLANYYEDEERQEEALNYYQSRPAEWINHWAWTYDPRNSDSDTPAVQPFVLYDIQEDLIGWIDQRRKSKENGLVEKSRDMGATWTVCAYYVHQWLFNDGFSGGVGSRKESLVDRKGDPDSIFEKIRIILENLPGWMMPDGLVPGEHDNFCRLINPDTGSTIVGEVGDNMGRGGRSSIYVIDEHAFINHADKVDRAVSQNSDCVIYLSTPNGPGNLFYQKRHSDRIPVFTMHWKDHPEKDKEWYEKQQEENSDLVVAQEIDIDYSQSLQGVCIKGDWVRSAVQIQLEPTGSKQAGLDVAGSGDNKSAYVSIQGPVVTEVDVNEEENITTTAWWAYQKAMQEGVDKLRFDKVGVGAGVEGTYESSTKVFEFDYVGYNGGDKPSGQKYWDSPSEPANERFLNRRAEDWWHLRLRFLNTYEHQQGIAEHEPDEMISIPEHSKLISELSSVKVETTAKGKIKLESKRSMKSRGVSSPDIADALSMAMSKHTGINEKKTIDKVWFQ